MREYDKTRRRLSPSVDGLTENQRRWIDFFYAYAETLTIQARDKEVSKTVKAMYKPEDLKKLHVDNKGTFLRLEQWIDALSNNPQAIKDLLAGTLSIRPIEKYFDYD
jgi:hypothetical protein